MVASFATSPIMDARVLWQFIEFSNQGKTQEMMEFFKRQQKHIGVSEQPVRLSRLASQC